MNRLLALCLVLQCIFSGIATQLENGRLMTHNASLSFRLPAQKKVLLMFWPQMNTPITLHYFYDGVNKTGKFNYLKETSTEPYFILIDLEGINMSKPATVEKPLELDPKPRSLTGRVLDVSSIENVTWEMYVASENAKGDGMTSEQLLILSLAASLGLTSLILIFLASYVFYLKKTTVLQPDVSLEQSHCNQMACHISENSLYGAVIR
ncbi:uncharacterized protein [Macrobrachium rosenbergii]|uniref:uncharacterized protein n=1 Tax=Macrobrachium rosenbergii TaxID=79674 RepID=UPI0034D3C5B4